LTVKNMAAMFEGAEAFNHPLQGWRVQLQKKKRLYRR
jgi:hypothetical protein